MIPVSMENGRLQVHVLIGRGINLEQELKSRLNLKNFCCYQDQYHLIYDIPL